MALYSIKDLEKLSGIKAHTIRIWEQRYEILQPQRTKSNIRYYQDYDLKVLLNIALLNKNGIKISKIADMSHLEIAEKVAAISEINVESPTQLDALTISMIEMDEYKFDRIISTNIQQMGFEKAMLEVIFPFLDKIGMLWLTGSIEPIQESFISNLIRQKIIVAIDNEPVPVGNDLPKFFIYTPPGERQELSILLMHFLIKSRKKKVIYLGQDISIQDLKDAHRINTPDFIFTLISESFTKKPIKDYVDDLSRAFPNTKLILSGYQVISQNISSSKNIKVLESLSDTISYINNV